MSAERSTFRRTRAVSERIFDKEVLYTAAQLGAFVFTQIFKRIFRVEEPANDRARAVGGVEPHKLRHGASPHRENGVDLLHHVYIVASLGAVKGKADIFKISDGVFLAVHIIRAVPRLLRLYLRIIDAFAHVSAAYRINTGGLAQIGSLFHAEGVHGYVFGAKSQYAVHRRRKAREGVARQPRDKIGVNARDPRCAGIRICTQKILDGVRTPDAREHLGAKRLRVHAYARHAAGCRNIQFDDCTWGIYCDTDFVSKTGMSPVDLQKVSELGVALNNAAIEGKPDDLAINTHVCRGNYHSTYAFEGGYDPIAPYLFAHEDVAAFYLEFDTPRAGGFEPLKYVAPGKKVVLGLVTTKAAELEDEDAIVERIHEAAKYVPLENLYLSPQCGFASCEIGNKLTEDEQWAKIALVKRVAERVWK